MEGNIFTKVVLPAALGIIMLGLGLGLTLEDFKRIFRMPRPVLVGLFCQTILLPLVAYGIAKIFALPADLAVGLMLLSASPGGASANVFSHLAHGDVALNITLTATNSVLSLLTLPVIVGLSLKLFLGAEQDVPLPIGKIVETFLVILLPVGIGMGIRAAKPGISERLAKPVRTLAFVFLIIVVAGLFIKEGSKVIPAFALVGIPALLFNLVSLGTGYVVPLALKLPRRQAVAIGMEIGIHNGTLAIAVATNVLNNPTMAIPPAIYSVIMFFTAAGFAFAVARSLAPEHSQAEVGAPKGAEK